MKKDMTHFSDHKLLIDAQIKKAITAELIPIKEHLNPYFFRPESRASALSYLQGLIMVLHEKIVGN